MWQNQITVDLDLTYFSKKEKISVIHLILVNQIKLFSLKRVNSVSECKIISAR